MYLHPQARKFYDLAITGTPTITDCEASFDGGTTFVDGEAVTGGFRWLVAGPHHQPEAGAPTYTTVAATIEPLLRFPSTPERDIERGPLIILTGP